MGKFPRYFVVVLVLAIIGGGLYFSRIDSYQTEGEIRLSALQQPVTVVRDSLGIPYITAQSMDDVLTTQGFIVAQDRMSQMEIFKLLAQGRLSEVVGEKGLKTDRLVGCDLNLM